jgi:uncharacterized coiled-coil protein SlyX
MRWIVAPLIAALLLCGSGFMRALEDTTRASIALARSSESAPKTTEAAVDEVETLPTVADLTDRQATAMAALADALEVSSQRVRDLNESVADQSSSLAKLTTAIDAFDKTIGCIETRLRMLLEASGAAPPRLGAIAATVAELRAAQEKSIRHLRSINRKLSGLGVAAAATDVEAPPPPGDAPAPAAGDPPGDLPC